MFWFSTFVLVAIGLGWPMWALWRKTHVAETTGSGLNISIYRDRLDELKADLQAGTLADDQFDQAKAELARALLQDLSVEKKRKSHSDGQRNRLIITLTVFILFPALALTLFKYLDHQIHFVEVSPDSNSPQAMQAYQQVGAFLFQLQQDPDNAEAWNKLGNGYMGIARPSQALQAYDRAESLGGETPELLVAKAHALGRLHRGDLSGEPARLIKRALALDPENNEALTWNGLLNFQRGRFDEALRHWNKLLANMPAETQQRHAIERLITQAKQRQQGIAAAPVQESKPVQGTKPAHPTTSTASSSGGAALKVRVELDATLKTQAAAGDSVFIYARASKGPRMPLAVVRKRVADLPVEVTLDDSMAMTPQFTLSTIPEVKVFARISKSGNATPQSGDFIGETKAIKGTRKEPVSITINTRVP